MNALEKEVQEMIAKATAKDKETIRKLKTALRSALDRLYETDAECAHPLQLFESIEAELFAAEVTK